MGDINAAKGSMRALISRFVSDQSAVSTTDYGLIAAGVISITIIAIAFGFGSERNDTYTSVSVAYHRS